jgi:hypothetical protein
MQDSNHHRQINRQDTVFSHSYTVSIIIPVTNSIVDSNSLAQWETEGGSIAVFKTYRKILVLNG